MASAKTEIVIEERIVDEEVHQVALLLTKEEAETLRGVCWRHVAGIGPARNAMSAIGVALSDAGVELSEARQFKQMLWDIDTPEWLISK